MSQAPSVAFAANEDRLAGAPAIASGDASSGIADRERSKHCVSLKGTTRGLEILISGTPPTSALGAQLTELLAEAPSFFAGCEARVAIDGALPAGALACLEEVATRFELRIVEISPVAPKRRRAEEPRSLRPEDVDPVRLAEATGPVADELVDVAHVDPAAAGSASNAVPGAPDAAAQSTASVSGVAVSSGVSSEAGDVRGAAVVADDSPPGPRLVIGPLRSGTIVEHPGHLVVIGDVNPGAEVRAEGSIIVLGRLRGIAHAGIGCDGSFVVALSLQPQQVRIGRTVARAGDADRPGDGAEIAYATGETIVVERFRGRLPSGLAASM
jgi:septum formation inhibitor MinC